MPPLESLGTMVDMAYNPVGALWRLGLVVKQILNKREIKSVVSIQPQLIYHPLSMSILHRVDYKCHALTISVPPNYRYYSHCTIGR